MNRDRVKVTPVILCEGLIHRATLGKLWIGLFSTRQLEYGLRETQKVREGARERGMERITEDLWCLSPPVRGPFLWQARKYFSNLSPCWKEGVIDTNMCPPLTHPCPSLSLCCSSSALSLNLLVMMQLIESGESRGKQRPGGKKMRKRGIRPQSLRDSRSVENVHSFVSSSSSREHNFQEA